MAFGEIQLGEVVIVGLDVRTFRHREAHVGEDGDEFGPDLRERMDAALLGGCLAGRQRDVDGLGGEAGIERGIFQNVAARAQRFGHLVLGEIDLRAFGLALVRRHLAERRKQRGDRAFLAKCADAHGFERSFIGSRGNLDKNFGFKLGEIRHAKPHRNGFIKTVRRGSISPAERSGAIYAPVASASFKRGKT